MRLVAALNASNLMSQAITTLGVAGTRPPPLVIDTVRRLADTITTKGQPPTIPPAWDASPGTLALRDAMAGVARVLSRDWSPGDRTRAVLRDELRERSGVADRILKVVGGGQVSRTFVVRLMACMGVAGLVSEVLPLQRSYWVPLTVAIVLKPDYGSVFARAVQRGIGTIVGAVAGAVLLALFHGAWLLIPFGVLAALLPYGREQELRAAGHVPHPAGGVASRPAQAHRLAAGRGPAGRHADRLRDRAGHRVRPVADELVCASAREVRPGGAGCLRVHARGAGRFWSVVGRFFRGFRCVAGCAARRLRSTYRALGDLRAEFQRDDVRAAVDQPQRDGLVARRWSAWNRSWTRSRRSRSR